MTEMSELKNALQNHEKRISKLEKLLEKNPRELRKKKTKTSITDLIIEVKEEGFFDKPKSRKDILSKLEELGHIYESKSIDSPIMKALQKRILGRKKIDGIWHYVKR